MTMTLFNLTWLKHFLAIFFLTFIHEDAAILAAGFSRVEHHVPLVLVYTAVFTGIVAGDVFIYLLGRFAQKNAWLRRKIIGPKVERLHNWIESNLTKVLIMCRLTPGLLFPTFVACGWFKIPLGRFTLLSAITGGVYTSIALTLVIVFGDLVLVHLNYWAWILVAIIVIVFASTSLLKPKFAKVTERALDDDEAPSFLKMLKTYKPGRKNRHTGMPSPDGLKRFVSLAERLPNGLFYLPVGLRWLFLSARYRSLTLPTVSNPMIETGGFWGESKSDIMEQVGDEHQQWVAEFVTFERNGKGVDADLQDALSLMKKKGLEFPVVVKPDVGWQGYGVRLVEEDAHLLHYLNEYPTGEKLLLQRPVQHDGEAGIFYVRYPGEEHGKVISVTLRYFPYVYGDGTSTLRDLIRNNPRMKTHADYYLGGKTEHMSLEKQYLDMVPADGELIRLSFIGSIRVGGLYRDASHLITPELSARIDAIAQSMPEFYFGRFDVRFESTELLQKGEGFSIIEINGAGSEAISGWDPEVSIFKLYKALFKSQSLLFKVGHLNRSRGYKPMTVKDFLKAAAKQNKLIDQYPPAS
ncbi:VTT domain-containing protein [Prolixibacter sp. NT017]|uniref:VTT domain-containing protein n=1 Tax=Prolixibacter sp. NT017 TaxID=2652390 RepID=UPI0012788C8F|nr:VTT domain-containing protein [Prolixibacter sp. NT017]GET25388.1 hypothetical protein NT017_17170 [Prolixibacter sp. NT017]